MNLHRTYGTNRTLSWSWHLGAASKSTLWRLGFACRRPRLWNLEVRSWLSRIVIGFQKRHPSVASGSLPESVTYHCYYRSYYRIILNILAKNLSVGMGKMFVKRPNRGTSPKSQKIQLRRTMLTRSPLSARWKVHQALLRPGTRHSRQ